jgi:hypothetical protein
MESASTAGDLEVELQKASSALPRSNRRVRWLERVTLTPLARLLRTDNQSATLDRLFVSQHVQDLQLIGAAAIFLFYLIVMVAVLVAGGKVLHWIGANYAKDKLTIFSVLVGVSYYVSLNIGKFLYSVWAAPVALGAALTWGYQVGSARLGVVDLFACEISTLCRVASAVDVVRQYVERFKQGPAESASSNAGGLSSVNSSAQRPFTSEENYFPVFASNSRDLEALEARVVIRITEFYTYMKAVRDMQRALAQVKPEADKLGEWREDMRNIVYMLYLGLESARYAICLLVEFEPEQIERVIVILISELEAYRFLCGQFSENDVRRKRILLRERDYQSLVPLLTGLVKERRTTEADASAHEPLFAVMHWEPAWVLLPELQERYRLAVGGNAETVVEREPGSDPLAP